MTMYVICFYWQGDRWQQEGYKPPAGHINLQKNQFNRWGKITNDLPARYINNLYEGVKRFADHDFKFICFTNEKMIVDSNIEIRPFLMIVPDGVLPRLYMFSEAAGLFGHQVLCLDIDVVIVGSLNKLMSYDGLYCARSDFGRDHKPDGDVISFKAGKETENIFWKPFINNIPKALEITRGRERLWIWYVTNGNKSVDNLWDQYAPGNVVSYKIDVRRIRNIPKEASIVSCHGYPRPHQIKDNWIKQYWK